MKNYQVDDTQDKTGLGGSRNICPYCHSDLITYESIELEGESAFFPAQCDECLNTWNEWYDLTFAGNWGYPLIIKKRNKKKKGK